MSGDDLRRRLAEGESVLMPGVWDALSVRLAAQAGFSTVFLSGYCVSGTLLGLPDVGYLTQGEMAAVAARVCPANPETTVVVDADTGYGNPLNVARTVELWEQAGASGMFLEDQVWPKRCGHMAVTWRCVRRPTAARSLASQSSLGTTCLPAMWPQRLGQTWSSRNMPDAPACSHSSTVRTTLSGLP